MFPKKLQQRDAVMLFHRVFVFQSAAYRVKPMIKELAQFSVENPACRTGPLYFMKEITTTAANGTSAAPTTIQQ